MDHVEAIKLYLEKLIKEFESPDAAHLNEDIETKIDIARETESNIRDHILLEIIFLLYEIKDNYSRNEKVNGTIGLSKAINKLLVLKRIDQYLNNMSRGPGLYEYIKRNGVFPQGGIITNEGGIITNESVQSQLNNYRELHKQQQSQNQLLREEQTGDLSNLSNIKLGSKVFIGIDMANDDENKEKE